jgi:hypothetical protein
MNSWASFVSLIIKKTFKMAFFAVLFIIIIINLKWDWKPGCS